MKKMNNKGFSLVELIIVIAIMAVLMGVLAPQFLKYVESSRKQKDESAAEEVRNATEIAMSNEKIYQYFVNDLSGSAKVTVSTTGGVKATGFDLLQKELDAVIGDISFTSAAHAKQTYTVTIGVDGNGIVTVKGDPSIQTGETKGTGSKQETSPWSNATN